MIPARQLPEYAKPPVVEVALSIRFEPIGGLHAGHLGLLWQEYRDRYPILQQQPPLPVVREEFEVARPAIAFNFTLQQAGMPRLWFLNRNGTRLVQVQNDHFVVNWRRSNSDEPYPRYPFVRQLLVDELDRFRSLIAREGLPDIKPLQTELSYVNLIGAALRNGRRKPLAEILRLWSDTEETDLLPPFEDATLQARYVLQDEYGPSGRLHVVVDPQQSGADGTPVYALTLVARNTLRESDITSALASFDNSHASIIQVFTALTTEEMQATWERQR